MAATMAAVKQQQMQLKQQQSGHNNGKSQMPDFFTNKNDMGMLLIKFVVNKIKRLILSSRKYGVSQKKDK